MRIKINLLSQPAIAIPIDYNYNIYMTLRRYLFDYLSAAKPKLLNRYKKTLPDFTFSQLMIPGRKVELGFIEITGTYLSFYVSSCDDSFIEYLARAVNRVGEFPVHNKKFKLKKIEVIDPPQFSAGMNFRMLSPLLLVRLKDDKVVFVRPGDNDLNEIFSTRLAAKYNALFKTNYTGKDIVIQLDQGYIERKKNLTRLLTIHNIDYKTIFSPIRLIGAADLIKFAYDNGIGEKTQYGLGMIETVED
ncbi:MAG TPA: CRISPR-associated endoribonuclease Cas6 [Candidatus Kapabacteria bacterium]|nr:CRISPR-associated endoribonuclease Cas6 [Candidatus Kapabacteria bacterium]